ncbi:MAG: hypothetical protein GXO19_04265 [Epsilonproteobacteria bacterium]|nr:hypothetical protein [Campylobacterota bacterium]
MRRFVKHLGKACILIGSTALLSFAQCYPEGWNRTLFPGHTADGELKEEE